MPVTEQLTPETIAQHGIKPDEYQVILNRLGRAPNLLELGIFSVMWSEHCSYKSSRIHLSKFPTSGPAVIQGPGENAGVIDIGDGQACIFKMESHNHPSFIEPYQGAATGVGGIMRDVFTMGARPVALANAIRFGEPENANTKRLLAGVVSGIGGYGNCVGVPTVCGETNFDKSYNGNILVNAMCVGLAETDKIFYSRGAKIGSPIVYFGSKTGRDGIHGATMASADFDEGSEEKRPTVQVGDPFMEKLLIEATLELMQTDCIEAIQDMGAAGLTSSSVEMAGKEGLGIVLKMNDVPVRETHMTPYEMMLSESQERMLAILKPGEEHIAQAIMEKWDLDYAVIGYTTDTGRLVLEFDGEIVCDIPIGPLSEDAPKYDRPWVKTPPQPPVHAAELGDIDFGQAVLKLLACPDIASKRWVWEQYDRHVMADTLAASDKPFDAALVRVHGTNKALAITTDCTPRYVLNDPYEGGKQIVAESYRNIICTGAKPIAITDNLNFGNPEKPETAIEGMAEACRILEYPVVSGNVSLYNETMGQAILPTPVVGGVGLIGDYHNAIGYGGIVDGDLVFLIGETTDNLGATLALRELSGRSDGAPPRVDLPLEKRTAALVSSLIAQRQIKACHDLSNGGFALGLAKLCMASNIGIDAQLPENVPTTAALFAETQARYLVVISPDNLDGFNAAVAQSGLLLREIGAASGANLVIADVLSLSTSAMRKANENWLPEFMG
ncbi:MAG: phosphoribosylformylglycinamidine synthase [Hyphomonadaceae bacterium]|nr:MAG: phosphoribosylformylglycinamidine synthase [Hyphomonadaceae bacterium]